MTLQKYWVIAHVSNNLQPWVVTILYFIIFYKFYNNFINWLIVKNFTFTTLAKRHLYSFRHITFFFYQWTIKLETMNISNKKCDFCMKLRKHWNVHCIFGFLHPCNSLSRISENKFQPLLPQDGILVERNSRLWFTSQNSAKTDKTFLSTMVKTLFWLISGQRFHVSGLSRWCLTLHLNSELLLPVRQVSSEILFAWNQDSKEVKRHMLTSANRKLVTNSVHTLVSKWTPDNLGNRKIINGYKWRGV